MLFRSVRFEWQFAVGAIATLVLDVTKTVGFLALTGLDFSLTAIAAVLTLIGYSVNDKVVVYDRMRENLRRYKSMPLRELIDLQRFREVVLDPSEGSRDSAQSAVADRNLRQTSILLALEQPVVELAQNERRQNRDVLRRIEEPNEAEKSVEQRGL